MLAANRGRRASRRHRGRWSRSSTAGGRSSTSEDGQVEVPTRRGRSITEQAMLHGGRRSLRPCPAPSRQARQTCRRALSL